MFVVYQFALCRFLLISSVSEASGMHLPHKVSDIEKQSMTQGEKQKSEVRRIKITIIIKFAS